MLSRLTSFRQGAARELAVSDFTMEEGSIRVVEEFPLDIFTQMRGHTYTDLLPLANEHEVQDCTIRYLSAEGLIRLKKDSLRPKDQLDVQALRQILRERQAE